MAGKNYWNFITQRRSFAEYWKHFVVRLNGVHAFSYNSTRSEPIWKKFGTLRVHCLELAVADFGRDTCRSESDGASRNFFLSGKQRATSPASGRPISRNLHTRRGAARRWIISKNICENLPVRHSSSKNQPNFVAWFKEWNYRTFVEGVTYIRLGGHHVGNRPIF